MYGMPLPVGGGARACGASIGYAPATRVTVLFFFSLTPPFHHNIILRHSLSGASFPKRIPPLLLVARIQIITARILI